VTKNPDSGFPQDDLYYRRLDVVSAASHDEIVRAYRRLALDVHPDAHPEDPTAPRRFREITEAYEVLADPGRRQAYDGSRLGRPVPVPVRHVARGADDCLGDETAGQVSARHQSPPTFVGRPQFSKVRGLPLRAGPVRVEVSSNDVVASSDVAGLNLAELLMEMFDWWGRR
jgi:curved DNA-binding protein CbpA